jgi:hypothetical protein
MSRLASMATRVLFIVAFLLAALALWEKLFKVLGASMFPDTKPLSMLQTAGVIMLFVISMQLHELLEFKRDEQWRDNGRDED